MELDDINQIIRTTWNSDIEMSLRDANLLKDFMIQKSSSNKYKIFQTILKNFIASGKDLDECMKVIFPLIIPSGTKGVIRGLTFNKIVKSFLLNLNLPLVIRFESQHTDYHFTEIPDFYIHDTDSGKILIGLNQIDLWNGGAQMNRSSKYLNANLPSHIHLVCVVCSFVKIKSKRTKIYELFNQGFLLNRLCYLNGIESIISNFFN